MPKSNPKLLVDFLQTIDRKQAFFAVWLLVVGASVLAMWRWLKKSEQRNFRGPDEGPGQRVNVDLRRLPRVPGSGTEVTPVPGKGISKDGRGRPGQ